MSSCRVALAALVVHLLIMTTASAQTGPALLIRPLPEDVALETTGDVIVFDQGETDNGDADYQLTIYDTAGRVRERRENFQPRIGYDFTHLDIDTDDPVLPDRLTDMAVAAGFALPDVRGFTGGLTVGIGYAGDGPFGDPQAFYGKATAVFGKNLDENTDVALVLDYDGNRAIFPDIPLPGFAYRKRLDPRLLLVAGLPISSLEWRPIEPLRIELVYALVDRLDVRVDYTISKHVAIFASFDQRREAFEMDELPEHDRLLFEQRRVEAGVRWKVTEDASLLLAGGYAFAQEFAVGFDFQDTDKIAEPSDEPYVRLGFEARF